MLWVEVCRPIAGRVEEARGRSKGGQRELSRCDGRGGGNSQTRSKVIEGALAGLCFTAVALQSGLVVVDAPRTDVVALTPRTLEGPIFPAQRMDVGWTRFGVEEVVQMRNHRHG